MDGLLSDQPDRTHDSLLKPDLTRDYVGQKLGRLAIVTGFRRISLA